MKQTTFHVAGMCCPTEEQLIRNRLKTMPGVEELVFRTLRQELTVSHRLDDDRTLLTALNALGMEASIKGEPAAEHEAEQTGAAPIPRATWIAMGVSGVAAALAEVAALMTGRDSAWPVVALSLLSIAVGGRDTIRKGLLSVRTFTLNINFLMTVAIIGAIAIGQWPEAAMVTFLFGVAEMIEAYSLDRARGAIRALMQVAPETAFVQEENGLWGEVRASAVQIGQIVRVRPGERIALDGEVIQGQSAVNQAPITGESIPVEKRVGDTVFAGTVNERGTFDFRVTAAQGHTMLDRIALAVQEAQGQRAPTQRFVDQFARYYTPGVFVLAIGVTAVPPLLFGAAFLPWLYRALVLLVIACPCALVISTPVTVVSGLAAAARRGILIKGGVYLEGGRKLKVIALDKTGTLTVGKPAVTDVVPLEGMSEREALHLAASLDALSEHPVASAIVGRWMLGDHAASGPGALLPVSDFESITGRGVKGTVGGRLLYVGNRRLAEENGVCAPQVQAELLRLEAAGKTAVVLTDARQALAVIGVADTVRDTSVEAVRALHRLGVTTVMLTGDNETTARAIAAQVGIDDVRGGLLPEDKLAAVGALQKQYGAVGMVGDGINDAPALARSDIGFAMGAAGTDTALETADVALMEDDLRKLPEFLRLSRQAGQILAQNIAFSITVKVVFFGLALAGTATLWMAVFADMGASLIVVANGLRLLRFGRQTAS